MTSKIIGWLVKQGSISEEDIGLYEYAYKSICFTLIPILVGLIFSAIMGKTIGMVFILAPFLSMRSYTGGYHLKSKNACLFCSTAIIIALLFLSEIIDNGFRLDTYAAFSTAGLFALSPVSPNGGEIPPAEKKYYAKKAKLLCTVWFLAYQIFILIGFDDAAICTGLSIILTFCLQLAALALRR